MTVSTTEIGHDAEGEPQMFDMDYSVEDNSQLDITRSLRMTNANTDDRSTSSINHNQQHQYNAKSLFQNVHSSEIGRDIEGDPIEYGKEVSEFHDTSKPNSAVQRVSVDSIPEELEFLNFTTLHHGVSSDAIGRDSEGDAVEYDDSFLNTYAVEDENSKKDGIRDEL